ncbi:hypothetical protein Btru_054604 [Bulinus truncatus]|nr:hypothetical protein Btru_054604 [Bulinus truncatus]
MLLFMVSFFFDYHQEVNPLSRLEPITFSKDVLAPTTQNKVSQETQKIKPVDVNKARAQKPVTITVQDTEISKNQQREEETVRKNANQNGAVSKSSVESPSLNVKPSQTSVKSITDVLSDMKKNTLVWKDKFGNIFSTFSSESYMETSIADVLDVFYFDRPELIIRLMGNIQKKHSLFKSREVPDLVYCVSYTGKGGINILPQSMRRRFVQLVNDTGAWIVSEYKNTDILESTHQPFVVPEQKEPKFYTDISSWPPNFTYSSVHLGNIRILKESSHPYCECIIVSGGDDKTFRKLLELAKKSDCYCIIVLKGTGGLADILASAVLEKRHFKDVSREITAITCDESSSEESDNENDKPNKGMDQILSQKSVEPKSANKYLDPTSKAKNIPPGNKGTAPHTTGSNDEELFRRLCDNITLFEPDLTVNDYRLGQMILLSLLKVYPEQKERLLKLCIDLDCFNLAEEHIFSARENFIRDKECLIRLSFSVVQSAFIKNRTKFIDYFLRQEMFEHMEKDENIMASIITDSRAMRFSDGTLWEVENMHSNEFLGIGDHLFRQCLVSHKIELSKLFWLRTQNPLGTLLLAAAFLKKRARKEKNHIIKSELKAAVQQYQTLAATFVRFCYDKDQETTLKMVTRKMDQFDGKSCIDLALSSSNLDFLDQPACVTVQRRVWRWGNLWDFYSENPDPEKNLWRKRSQSNSPIDIWRKSGLDVDESDKKIQKTFNISALKKYYLLLCVPMTMFTLNGIGLMIFIYTFGLTILGRFEQHKFHWLEAYLLLFVVVVAAEEIFEIWNKYKEHDLMTYITSGWNVVDLISVLLFFTGTVLRVVAYFSSGSSVFYAASIAFSLDFIVFTFRLLHNCYSSPVLGPTCAMIIKTVQILTRFLYIFAIFWASYAVASEAILYPNSVLSYYTFFYLFRKAYWQMFGELFLDEIDAGKSEDSNSLQCTTDPSLYGTYELLRCPTPLGRYYVPVLLAVYVLFTNILLNSLITASFSKSIEKIQQKAEKLWRFQFFLLTRDFSKILFLPVPFTLISVLARLADEDDRKVDGFSVIDITHIKQYEDCLKEKLDSMLDNSPEMQQLLSQDIKRMKKNASKRHSMKSSDIMELISSIKDIFSKIIMSQKLQDRERTIKIALSEIFDNQEISSRIQKDLNDFINEVIKYRCCQDKLSAQHPYRKDPNLIMIIRDNLKKASALNQSYSKIKEHIADLETLILENVIILELEEKIKNYNIKIDLSEVEKKISELEKFQKENRKNLFVEKSKALNFIWSRFNEFKKMYAQKSGQVNNKIIHEMSVEIQGLLMAVKYYEHISIEPDVRSMLDDLEAVLLQETQAGHFYMSDRVRDLELFVLQNFIEPDMYREWQKKEADERNEVDRAQSNRAVSPDAIKDTEDKTKGSLSNRGSEENKNSDEELGLNWVPMYKDSQMKFHQNKSNDKQRENAGDGALMNEISTGDGALMNKSTGDGALMNKSTSDGALMNKSTGDGALMNKSTGDGALMNKSTGDGALMNKSTGDDKIKFNHKDKKRNIDRRSYLGRYEVNSNGPVNPLWSAEYQTDASVDEKLLRWGPNHFGVPIITRIKHKDGKIFRKDDKLVIEFLVEKKVTPDGFYLKNQSEDQSAATLKYRFPEVPCSPSNDPFIEFINRLPEKAKQQTDKTPHVPPTKFVQAVKIVITLMNRRKLFLKSQDEIEMKHCQKMMSIYIGPVVRQAYMTPNKWMEIFAINYHNPHTQHQLTIEQAIQTGQNYEWIDYTKYKEVDVITDSRDVFENICTKWGAYVERRPSTARKSARPTRPRTAHSKILS